MATLTCTGVGVLTRNTPYGVLTIVYYQMDGEFVAGNNNYFSVPRDTKLFLQGASVLVDANQSSPFASDSVLYFQGQYNIYSVYRSGVDIYMEYIDANHVYQRVRIARGAEGYCGAFKTLYRDVNGSFSLTDQQSLLTGPLNDYTQYVAPTSTKLGYYASNSSMGSPLSGWQNLDLTRIRYLTDFINVFYVVPPTDDPYGPGGTSQPSPKPPTGNFNNTSDPIDPAALPVLSAVDTKFITLFTPDPTQLRDLASYMWGGLDLTLLKKIFSDPMDAILGLSIVPVVPDQTSSPQTVTLGNIQTTVSMPKITTQYKQINCGTLSVDEYWGAYLDYSPYTKIEIYLPYIGIQTLNADDIMGKDITVIYNIDVLSGACVAMIKCDDTVLYSFGGSCAVSLPVSGRDWTSVINGVIGIATAAAGIAVAGATGGAAAAATAAGGALGSTASQLTSIKPTVQKSGTMASAVGILGIQKPYLIITRPRQALPQDQNTYTGYPSYITTSLRSCTGFTRVDQIHLVGIKGTDAEVSEILSLLREGVIL